MSGVEMAIEERARCSFFPARGAGGRGEAEV